MMLAVTAIRFDTSLPIIWEAYAVLCIMFVRICIAPKQASSKQATRNNRADPAAISEILTLLLIIVQISLRVRGLRWDCPQ